MAINVQGIERFKFIAHKIIPLVYDDSLSYYEFLCKVMQKLNEVISSLDNQNKILEEFDEDIISWETTTDNKYNLFVTNIYDLFYAFKQDEITARTVFMNSLIGNYNDSVHYTIGQYVRYGNNVYKCTTATSGEAWNPEHWTQVVYADDLSERQSDYEENITGQQNAFKTEITGKQNEFESYMQTQWNEFFNQYLQTLGVVQTTGTSTMEVMSQKAVTDELAEKVTKLSAGTSELAYTVQTSGAQSSCSITESTTGGTIVKRTSAGEIKASDPTADDSVATMGFVKKQVEEARNITHYGARWNKTQAQMTRLYDAESFPTDTKNFGHFGSVNADYSNPFDNIYPWAGIKLCNISIDLYRNLAAGDSITRCVTAWEGDVDFSYNDANGVWRYRPEFYGKSWEDSTYRYFDVSETAIGSYVHYPEAIVGRWHGRAVTLTVGEVEKTCLVPSVGMPANRIAMSTLHTYAKNYGATIDSIFSIDADVLLCIVEFATMNTQKAIGNGVSNLYRQSSDLIQEDATNSTTVKVLAAAGSEYCIPGAIFDIGTSNGGTQVGSFVVVSATPNVGNAQYLDVTLNEAVTVTAANYWSVHGLVNVADEGIGSKSGYIGTNGKCNAYYRGIVMFGNMWFYILGAYENKDDHHIWIANSDEEADNSDALDTTVHYDTGLVLPTAGGYTKKLGLLSRSGLLSIPVFCVETGGDSSNPVGDYFYNGVYTYNTVLLRGGYASYGSYGGAFSCGWYHAASNSNWNISARPRLKNP